MMFAKKKVWGALCCKASIGACKSCSMGMGGYVVGGGKRYENYLHTDLNADKQVAYMENHLRMCPNTWMGENNELAYKGMKGNASALLHVTFHELTHMLILAIDYGYSPIEMMNMAHDEPKKARMNAGSFTAYLDDGLKLQKGEKVDYDFRKSVDQTCKALASTVLLKG